jgi:hypothetical protein
MRILSHAFPSGTPRKSFLVFGFLIFATGAAYVTARFIISGDLASLSYAGLIFVGGAIVLAVLHNWRRGVYLFLGWLLFEDFARKFLGNNMAIFFAKDFLVLVLYIAFLAAFRRKEIQGFRPPFLVPLLIFIWFGVIQMFNPASTTIWYGVLGFKLFFYYVPLVFVGYAFLESEIYLRRFFTVNLIFALVIISLGIAQSVLGQGFLNPELPAEDIRALSTSYRVAPISGAIAYRPTSVFVSGGRYTNFILITWLLVLGYTGYLLLRHRRGRNLAFLAVAAIAGGAVLSASRGAFMWAMINGVVTSVAFIWGAPWRQGEARRAFRGIQRALLGIALGIVLLFFAFPDALLSRIAIYKETLLPSSPTSELANRGWDYPLQNFLGAFNYERWPYGYGIGTTSLGTQYIARFFNTRPPVVGVESGFGTLVVEMGIGGLLLWFLMSGTVVFSAGRTLKALRGSPWFPIAFIIFWYAFILLFPVTFAGMQPYEDFLLNAYLWLLLGILFRLPTIALSTQFAAAASTPAAARRWIP